MNCRIKTGLACLLAFSIAFCSAGPVSWAQDSSSGGSTTALRKPVVMKYNDEVPMGTHRVKDEDGRSNIVYSTGGPSESTQKRRKQAEEDRSKSWEMLSHIVIDTRSYQDDTYSTESATETTQSTGATE